MKTLFMASLLLMPLFICAQTQQPAPYKPFLGPTAHATIVFDGDGFINSGAEVGVMTDEMPLAGGKLSLTAGYRTYSSEQKTGYLDMYRTFTMSFMYHQDVLKNKKLRISERFTSGYDWYREVALAVGYRVDEIAHLQLVVSKNNRVNGASIGMTLIFSPPIH
jgi:hypothetical protein